MKVIYQSSCYKPELITGIYVRCQGRKRLGYVFRVFEAASSGYPVKTQGKPGHGPTLREYDCDGSEFTEEFRNRCIASKQTELLRYQ